MSSPVNTSVASVPTDRAGDWFLTYGMVTDERWAIIVNSSRAVTKIECSNERLPDVMLHIIATMEKR